MKKIFVLILLSLVSFGVCEAQSKIKTKTKKTKNGRIMWRLHVDFISKGSGIDNAVYTKVTDYANNHPKKPAYNVLEQGREGEKQIYWGLAELTEDEQYTFVEEVNKLITDPKLVKSATTLPKRKVTAVKAGVPLQTTGEGMVVSEVTYRLIVSFISKGAGIDQTAKDKVKAHAESHPKKPAFEVQSWGREGETDFLFSLKELTADEQALFVNEVKGLVSRTDMVFIKENSTAVKKGK